MSAYHYTSRPVRYVTETVVLLDGTAARPMGKYLNPPRYHEPDEIERSAVRVNVSVIGLDERIRHAMEGGWI